MAVLIKNIKTLYGIREQENGAIRGKNLNSINSLNDAWLLISDGLIADYGTMSNIDAWQNLSLTNIIDASGKLILPCFVDSHTHIVFAKTREAEFVDRINGLTYEEIAANGGGILNSAAKLHLCSEDELFDSAWSRLKKCIKNGTGAIEIKSGYGLSVDDELKMLRVIKRLKTVSPILIKATFLGAHAIPQKYKSNRAEYIDLICDTMLPLVAKEELADYCDVFCDSGFFTPEETDIILKKAKTFGLKPKIHANELGLTGGVQIGVLNEAISVDHLEHTSSIEHDLLYKSNTMATLLPSTAFFLGIPYPDARAMINADLALCLASDYNPGSSPSGRMSFILSLACIRMKMTPTEALNAATINGAYALELEKSCGSITKGKLANIILTQPADSIDLIPYNFGEDLIEQVFINGEIFE